MAHRRGIKQDSLELLLDTICNTFGGVLFIAILVVMLLAQAGTGVVQSEVPTPTPEELEARSRQLATLSAEVLRQQQIQASQAALVESLVPDTIRELINRRKQLLAEQCRQQQVADAQQAQNAVLAANVARTKAAIDKVLADLNAAQQQEAEARTLLASEEKARVKESRLPLARNTSSKREVGLIVRYGRLYLWHTYDLRLNRTGLNLRDFVVISEEEDQLLTRPKPMAGILLDDTPECRAAIDTLLKRFDSSRFSLAIVVHPDSYGAFQHVRNRSIALHFDYRLMPTTSDTPIVDRGGEARKVQ